MCKTGHRCKDGHALPCTWLCTVTVMHRHQSAAQLPESTCPRPGPRGGSAPRRSGPSCTCRRDAGKEKRLKFTGPRRCKRDNEKFRINVCNLYSCARGHRERSEPQRQLKRHDSGAVDHGARHHEEVGCAIYIYIHTHTYIYIHIYIYISNLTTDDTFDPSVTYNHSYT
jgi:hypothetical protein